MNDLLSSLQSINYLEKVSDFAGQDLNSSHFKEEHNQIAEQLRIYTYERISGCVKELVKRY